MKSTVSGVFEGLKFKISEGYKQNWCFLIFRFTNAETLNHDEQTRNECSSKSGGFKLFGFGTDTSSSKCRGSLSDTTQGQNTAVKRFSSRSYGTLPQVHKEL